MGFGSYELRSIGEILKNADEIGVPFFQRSYSWKKTEFNQFYEDLERINENREPYFIGSIFLSEENGRLSIIDGQQRLTTATILIAVVRDIFLDSKDIEDNYRSAQIENDYISKKDFKTQVSSFRLKLGGSNLSFFKKQIQAKNKAAEKMRILRKLKKLDNPDESNKLILECYFSFYNNMRKVSHEELADLVETLLNDFQVLTVTVSHDEDIFTIFETLNNRGMDLTVSDLLKNYLFSIIYKNNHVERKDLVSKWDEMITRLKKNVHVFFKHYWNTKYKPITEKKIYHGIKLKITTEDQVYEFLDEIFKEAEIYSHLIDPNHSHWDNREIEKGLIKEISTLGAKQCLSVILSSKLEFTNEEFIETLRSTIALTFQYSTVCKLQTKELENKYSQLAIDIKNGKIESNSIVREKLKEISPDEGVYEKSFKNLTYNKTNPKTPLYILKKINDSLDDSKEIVSSENITLEHITPLVSGDKQVVDKLYNMTILEKQSNDTASKKMFDDKVSMYRDSKLKINQKLSTYTTWTEKEMSDWGEYLFQKSKDLWKI